MKKKICLALAALMVFSLGGCVKAVKLTSEEQALIAEYSSYILVKHSRYDDSLLLSKDELVKAEAKKAEEDSKAAANKEAREKASSAASKEGSSEASSGEGKEGGSKVVPTTEAVTMTEAIGVNGLEFAYTGYEVVDYIQGDVFSLNASAGKQLVVMNYTVTNTSGSQISCNLRNSKYTFRGSFNGKTIVAMTTVLLPNDIASFDAGTKFEAGQKSNCVLVFDVPKDVSSQLNEVTLAYRKDGMTGLVSIKM